MDPDINKSTDQKQHLENRSTSPNPSRTAQEKEYQASSPTGSDIEQPGAFKGEDPDGNGAFKGDDSDGKVVWTPKTLIATISLSGLYVGATSIDGSPSMALTTQSFLQVPRFLYTS